MKNNYLLLAVALIALFFSAAVFLHANAPNHNTSFIYKVTSTAVVITVTYNPEQAPQVEKYIDSCLQPDIVFGNSHKVNKEVLINGQTNYHIKGSPGKLKMTAQKNSNSVSSIHRLKNIFLGLKSVIKAN